MRRSAEEVKMYQQQNYPPAQWAEDISLANKIIYCAGDFYFYENGFYRKWNECKIFKFVKDAVGLECRPNKINEIIACLRADCFIEPDGIKQPFILNLINGLFNVDTFEFVAHRPEVISISQLQVNYNPAAQCPLWHKTLSEIFEGDQTKINLLQEFFGLCLTIETKFEKALFLLGEGANGKSVVLYILQCLLGWESWSAIPLEKFDNHHYLASLFGKLANISIETNAKASVYDSNFKSIVSGDPITADLKFKPPFTFRPFCKLVFALNNMPRVDDKTAAFFRRLLILKFNRVFQEEEQNKTLKFELCKELDGIFLWSLEGLKRLRKRNHFEMTDEMRSEVEEYRKDNNNVILFVEEKCELAPDFQETKDELYRCYSDWCKLNNYMSLAKKRFGKELKKLYPTISGDERSSYQRLWRGIRKLLL